MIEAALASSIFGQTHGFSTQTYGGLPYGGLRAAFYSVCAPAQKPDTVAVLVRNRRYENNLYCTM